MAPVGLVEPASASQGQSASAALEGIAIAGAGPASGAFPVDAESAFVGTDCAGSVAGNASAGVFGPKASAFVGMNGPIAAGSVGAWETASGVLEIAFVFGIRKSAGAGVLETNVLIRAFVDLEIVESLAYASVLGIAAVLVGAFAGNLEIDRAFVDEGLFAQGGQPARLAIDWPLGARADLAFGAEVGRASAVVDRAFALEADHASD